MDRDSCSSTSSSGGQTSLCGLGGKSFRKSPRKQPEGDASNNATGGKESSAHTNGDEKSSSQALKSSPKESGDGETSVKTKKGKDASSPSGKSLKSSGAEDSQTITTSPPSTSNKQNRSDKKSLAERTRSFFHFRKKKPSSPTAPSGADNEEGGTKASPASGLPLESKDIDSKYGHRGTVSEIKPKTVAERRSIFENLSGEQPSKPVLKQPSVKTDKKVVTGTSALEEGPSCSYQVEHPEQLSPSSTRLEPVDELGTEAERKKKKKKHSKRSMPSFFKFFRSKRSSRENVEDKSKGRDKKKTKNKGAAGEANNEDESFDASGSSSHVKKSKGELESKTIGKDAQQPGKTAKHSLLTEQNKSREAMMKAVRKGVENLTVPESQFKPANVKLAPTIPEETTPAEADSPSERLKAEIQDNEDEEAFFTTPKSGGKQPSDPSATTDKDLDLERAPILPSTKKAMPQRNQKTSGNPLKKLAEREDVTTTYVEKPVADRSSGFTKEALLALAAKEDYNQVKLKKVDSSVGPARQDQPFKEKMLLLVKGRKNCHARLVEPCAKSMNTGDCFVLVTPNSVHVWLGESCNVLEKPKAIDVAKQIVVKKDLGYKASATEPIVIGQETKFSTRFAKDFWSIIGEKNDPKVQENGPPEEDENYEKSVIETNVVYKVNGRHLVPLEEFCGTTLKYDMLNANTSAVLIFDFGGEMYVWTGKDAPKEERQYGMPLAKELWRKGYDYTSFRLNPLSLLRDKKNGGLSLKDNARPAWALLGKVGQSTETILFKEKFSDWPGSSRIIQLKISPSQVGSKDDWIVELKPCDVDQMMKSKMEPVSFLWDGDRIGRCITWVDEKYGLKKEYEIETEGIDVWHVAEFDRSEVEEVYHGNFFDGDTYVIRWRYQVNPKGVGTGKGGRTRCSYFFWQGDGSSITEKGASALMTIELDTEKGPQVRVVQNKEPPCFLALFKGRMIIHKGKKDDKSLSSLKVARLYLVRNELPDEAYLMEVPVELENLRSRSSFLLLNAENDHLTIWHGARSPEHTKKRAKDLANTLRKWLSVKFSCDWKMSETEVNEGSESAAFWKTIGSSDRKQYDSLLKSSVSSKCLLRRAFHLSAVTCSFEAREVPNPSLNEDDLCCPFPVFQSDLYSEPQPALFLIDSGDVVYLWQGYWPLESSLTDNLKAGNADSRFIAERRCALATVLAYCKALNATKPPPAYVVFAGVEPVSFTNLFPTWSMDETARTSSLKDGKKLGQTTPASEVLANLMKSQYTLAELQTVPLPDGVDANKLESYLSDEEFKKVFDLDRDAFNSLSAWKQVEEKKSHGLY